MQRRRPYIYYSIRLLGLLASPPGPPQPQLASLRAAAAVPTSCLSAPAARTAARLAARHGRLWLGEVQRQSLLLREPSSEAVVAVAVASQAPQSVI